MSEIIKKILKLSDELYFRSIPIYNITNGNPEKEKELLNLEKSGYIVISKNSVITTIKFAFEYLITKEEINIVCKKIKEISALDIGKYIIADEKFDSYFNNISGRKVMNILKYLSQSMYIKEPKGIDFVIGFNITQKFINDFGNI